jgi:hypothetical protein
MALKDVFSGLRKSDFSSTTDPLVMSKKPRLNLINRAGPIPRESFSP